METSKNKADLLAETLFDGEVKAADFKTMPGSGKDSSLDDLSGALLDSMQRVGLIKDSKLTNMNASK